MKSARVLRTAAIIFCLAIDLSAQVRNQVFIGARPLAMGETFVAVADDGNAIYWNPAGLPAIDNYSLYGMHANLYNTGVRTNYLSFFLPFSDRLTLGADWLNLGFGDDELEYYDHKFNFAIGYKMSDKFSAGLNLKHLRFEGNFLDAQQTVFFNTRAQGWGIDLGVLYSPLRKLRLGIMAHDLTHTKVKHSGSGNSEVIQRRNLRYGVAYQLRDNLLLAADLDDRFHLGGEFWLADFVALRAGVQKDRHTGEGMTHAFGAGLDHKLLGQTLRLDYAYTIPPTLPSMHWFSLSIHFNLFAPLAKIENVEIEPVYASLYKHHSEKPIGTAVIKYKGKERLDCEISVAIPKYARPFRGRYFLQPAAASEPGRDHVPEEAVNEIPLHTIFTDSILTEEGNIPHTAEITLSYSAHRKRREEKSTARFDLFHRSQLDWSRGIEQAAAFIDPNDPAVVAAAKDFVDHVPLEFLISEAITTAKQIFEGLGSAGITYRVDPVHPYQYAYRGLDNVLYPYQLLKESKQGDCDDLTALYAALLENRDIATALVSVPEHIFLMFDTGIHERKRDVMSLPEELYLIHEQRVWVPVELTWVGRTFDEAWQMGAKIFQERAAAEEIEIVEVREAWKEFKPVAYPKNLKRTTPPVRDSLLTRPKILAQELGIKQRQQSYLDSLEQKVSQTQDSLVLRNRLARSYALRGEFAKAEEHLRAVMAMDSTNFVAYNNLGNVYFLQGELDSAEASYFKALPLARTFDDSMGIHLNLGALFYAADSVEVAEEMFAEVIEDSSDLARVELLLGINLGDVDLSKTGKQQLKQISAASVKSLALKAVDSKKGKKKSDGKKKKDGKKRTKAGARKGRRPSTEIANVFYWAR